MNTSRGAIVIFAKQLWALLISWNLGIIVLLHFTEGGIVNHEGSSCSLFAEALFVVKDGLIFLLRVLELLMTLHQEWEIC